jgi:hypothetical protein
LKAERSGRALISNTGEIKMERTDFVVDYMVKSFCEDSDEKEQFLFRHALVNLVKMAKAEKALEIQQDLEFVHIVSERSGSGPDERKH